MTSIGNKEILARNLKYYMNKRGVDRMQVCSSLGFVYSTFADWCNAVKYPRIDKIEMLANYFGIEKSDLIEDKRNRNGRTRTGTVALIDGVAAGSPIFADDNVVGYVPTDVRNTDECFALVVRGESMINASIPDGSKIIVHMQNAAEDGQIVVCRVNRDEATLKRFRRLGDHVLLMPENPLFEPIIVPAADFESGAAEIVGVVRQVIIDME